jgi:ASCH domain
MNELPKVALSIRQPWAWAIIHAGKDIENRNWRTSYRGPVCIHAGRGMTNREYLEFEGLYGFDRRWTIPEPEDLQKGGIIGVAEITDCVWRHPSPWFSGRWGFVLADTRPVDFIPVRGELGIFNWKRQEAAE